MEQETIDKIIESLGRERAKTGGYEKYIDNPEGFFEYIENYFEEKHSYDKGKGIIRIETPESDCFCPLVDSSKISLSVCQCSIGWQSQVYETIFGYPVQTKCIEPVVRGSTKYVFEIIIIR